MSARREIRTAEADWRMTDVTTRDQAYGTYAYKPQDEYSPIDWRDVGYFLAGSFCGSLGLTAVLLFLSAYR